MMITKNTTCRGGAKKSYELTNICQNVDVSIALEDLSLERPC